MKKLLVLFLICLNFTSATCVGLDGFAEPSRARVVSFETQEGSFMNLDVSKDGQTVVFDLLGSIYTLPIGGGTATPLVDGKGWNISPRYSPDGLKLAFISDGPIGDMHGWHNVYVMDLGSGAINQITHISADLTDGTNSVGGYPTWIGNGEIAYSGYSGGDFWITSPGFHVVKLSSELSRTLELKHQRLGTSSVGAENTKWRKVSLFGGTADADGKKFVFDAGVSTAGEPSATTLYALDTETQTTTALTEPVSGRHELGPQLSRSGRLLSYFRWSIPGQAELRLKDRVSGQDRLLRVFHDFDDPLRGYMAAFTAYSFTPDDNYIVMGFGGKIRKISVADGSEQVIPFKVHVSRETVEPLKGYRPLNDEAVKIKAVRWPTVSADWKRLVYSAAGFIWQQSLPNGKSERLTGSSDLEYSPSVSKDGKEIAYVAFTPSENRFYTKRGRLMVLKKGETQPVEVMPDDKIASYLSPSWSPDRTKLAVIRQLGWDAKAKAEFGWVDMATKTFHSAGLASGNGLTVQSVRFSPDGNQLQFTKPDAGGETVLFGEKDVRQDENPRITYYRAYVNATGDPLEEYKKTGSLSEQVRRIAEIWPSPDGKHVLTVVSRGVKTEESVFMLPVPGNGGGSEKEPIQLSTEVPGVVKLPGLGAMFPNWVDSGTVTYGWANKVYRYRIGAKEPEVLKNVDLTLPRRTGSGTIAFRGALLITAAANAKAEQVIENGTIVIKDRRIIDIGPASAVNIPPDAKVVDAKGMTIMPGMIDTHYHYGWTSGSWLTPLSRGEELADPSALAYGLTTIWEAQGRADDVYLSRSELRETGRTAGSRWMYANLSGIEGGNPNLTSVESRAERRLSLGASPLKQYCCTTRDVMRLEAEVSRRTGAGIVAHTEQWVDRLMLVTEGIAVDHAAGWVPIYDDIRQFMARSGVIWTPNNTLFNQATTGPYYQTYPSLIRDLGTDEQEKFQRYAGEWARRNEMDTLPLVPFERSRTSKGAEAAASILIAGGKISVSSHNYPGPLTHFEMWMLVRGGASPLLAIRSATLTGAEKLGIDRDTGSLAVGKIADFNVLTANPLEKIENSVKLKYTVADGVIYDSESLLTVDPKSIALTP